MRTFRDLYDTFQEVAESYEIEQKSLHDFVRPALNVFRPRAGIESVRIEGSKVYIEYGYSNRGYYDKNDITLPLWIFESTNIEEAAKKYQDQLEQSRKEADRQEKLEKITRLQKELEND